MSGPAASLEDDAPKQPVKARGKLKLILGAGGVLLLAAVVGALWFSGLLSHGRGGGVGHQKTAAVQARPVLVAVPDIVTNLDSGTRRSVFIRVKAKIEVPGTADAAVIAADMPAILDAFQTYIRSMRPEEVHGGEGTYRLKEGLMNRIDIIAAPVQVLDILFLEMVVQ